MMVCSPSRYLVFQSQQRKHQNNVWKLFKVNTRKRPEGRQQRRSGVFSVNFKRISHIVLVSPLLTLNK